MGLSRVPGTAGPEKPDQIESAVQFRRRVVWGVGAWNFAFFLHILLQRVRGPSILTAVLQRRIRVISNLMDAQDIETIRAWVDVDLGALVENYRSLQARANPRVGMLPVVKANAYGLGVADVVDALEGEEPWGYAVATLAEALELRDLGIRRPILMLFPTPGELAPAANAAVTPAIGDSISLRHWREIARERRKRLPFHLEIDTGMGRAGFADGEVDRWLPGVLEAVEEDLVWEGTFTHFHSAEVADEAPSREQWERLRTCLARFPDSVGGVLHVSGSAAAARWPEFAADLVRPGIYLYGAQTVDGVPPPRPVATVRARITSVRDVPTGWTASYGATYRAARPSRWATLGVGYGDGVRRELSSRGHVCFGESAVPIIGRVCMDVTVVDITTLPAVEPGDVATVIGGPRDTPVALEVVARRCGTIPYEILTGLTPRLRRRFLGTASTGGTAASRERLKSLGQADGER